MDIDFSSEGKVLTAKFKGELDHHNSQTAREKTDIMLDLGIYDKLIFDFSGLTFMDSSGIAVIMGRVKRLSSLNGKVSVICKNEKISRILKLSGVDRYVTLEEGEF